MSLLVILDFEITDRNILRFPEVFPPFGQGAIAHANFKRTYGYQVLRNPDQTG